MLRDLEVPLVTGLAGSAIPDDNPVGPGIPVPTKPFSLEALAAQLREALSAPRAIGR